MRIRGFFGSRVFGNGKSLTKEDEDALKEEHDDDESEYEQGRKPTNRERQR